MPILANCNDRRQDMAARARNSAAAPAAERELIIRRTFDAPRALVFRVWTEPQHLAQWSCPRGFTMTENSGELRVGGAFAACMRSPEGSDHRLRGVYREIDRKSTRLNSSHSQISYAVFCLKKKNDTISSYDRDVDYNPHYRLNPLHSPDAYKLSTLSPALTHHHLPGSHHLLLHYRIIHLRE